MNYLNSPTTTNKGNSMNAASIQQADLQVNTVRHLDNTNFEYLPRPLKRSQHAAIEELCAKKGYKANGFLILNEIIKSANSNGFVTVTQQKIADKLQLTRRTIINWMKRYTDDNVIKIDKMGWQQCNLIQVLAVQHLKPNKCENFSHNINLNNNLKENINITYYSEYVSSFSDKRIEEPKCRKSSSLSKRVSLDELMGADPDGEVIRVCMAYLLTEAQTLYAVKRMRKRHGMKCPASYLSKLAGRLKAGTENMEGANCESEKQAEYNRQQTYFRDVARRNEEATRRMLYGEPSRSVLEIIDNLALGAI